MRGDPGSAFPFRVPGAGFLLTSGLLLWAAACGPTELDASPEAGALPDTASAASALATDNGMTANGLVTNGLVTNGLVTNGLVTNGLATNGLALGDLQTAPFQIWFNSNPTSYSDMVMHYVVSCALRSGESLTWQNPRTGTRYTWYGLLGLTPGWASGNPATETEQQLITACLAAHVNKYGRHVQFSINGVNALGQPLPFDPITEPQDFAVTEACFFGNLFNGEGVFAANDRTKLDPSESTSRGCGLSSQASGLSHECAPMVHVGMCKSYCVYDSKKMMYVSCSYNGKRYSPLTTRIRTTDVFECGDGVCQFTESCGTTRDSNTYDNCGVDCGVCP